MRRASRYWRVLVWCVVGVVMVWVAGRWAVLEGATCLLRGRLDKMGFRPEVFQVRRLGLWKLEAVGLESYDGSLAVRSVWVAYSPKSLWRGRIEEVVVRGLRVNVKMGQGEVRVGPWGAEDWGVGKSGGGLRVERLWLGDGMVVLDAMGGQVGVPVKGGLEKEGEKAMRIWGQVGLPMGSVCLEGHVESGEGAARRFNGRVKGWGREMTMECQYLPEEGRFEIQGRLAFGGSGDNWCGLEQFGGSLERQEGWVRISAAAAGRGWMIHDLRLEIHTKTGQEEKGGFVRMADARGSLEWSGGVPEEAVNLLRRCGVMAEFRGGAKASALFEVGWNGGAQSEKGKWAVRLTEVQVGCRDVQVQWLERGLVCGGIDLSVRLNAVVDEDGLSVEVVEPAKIVCRGIRWQGWREGGAVELKELAIDVGPMEEGRAAWVWRFAGGEGGGGMCAAARLRVEGSGLNVAAARVWVGSFAAEFPLTLGCAGWGRVGKLEIKGVRVGGLEAEKVMGELAVEDGVVWLKADSGQTGVQLGRGAELVRGRQECERTNFVVQGEIDLRDAWKGQIRASLKDVVLSQAGDLGRLWWSVPGVELRGRFHVHVVVDVSEKGIQPWVTIEAHEAGVSLAAWKIEAEGMEALVHLDRLGPVGSPPWQWITVRRLRWGRLELEEGLIQFNVQSLRSVFVERMRWRWGERGRFWVHAFWLDPAGRDSELEVFLEDVGLYELLAVSSRGKVEGGGFLTGRVNLVVRPGRQPLVVLGQGYLEARPGKGWFRMTDKSVVASKLEESGLDMPGQLRQRIVDALCDFEFSNLSAELKAEKGESVFRLQMRGRGRSGPEAQAFESLTINLRGVQEVLDWVFGGRD